MHSESCLAVCLPLSACMILLFWFLKDSGCSVIASLLIGCDNLTRCSRGRVTMFQPGWMRSRADKWPAGWEPGALGVIPYLGVGPEARALSQRRRWRALAPGLEMTLAPWKSPGVPWAASQVHIWQQGGTQHPGPCERERGQEFKGRDYPPPSVSSCHGQFQALPAQEEHQKPAVSSVKGCFTEGLISVAKAKKTHKECVHAFYGLVGWVCKKQMNCRGRQKGRFFCVSFSLDQMHLWVLHHMRCKVT